VFGNTCQKIILIHGVGSFGHPQAKQYAVKDGSAHSLDDSLRTGVCSTRAAVLLLHSRVISTLNQQGVPAVSVSPFDHVITQGGVNATPSSSYSPMCLRTKMMLDQGYLPVLHGDVVLDQQQQCTILSGDVVMRELARSIPGVSRCVFLTDVDGVYDKDPKSHSDAQLITELQVKQQLDHTSMVKSAADVTGSMHGKVKWARQIIQDSRPGQINVVICRQGTPAATMALSGDPIQPSARLTVIK